MIYGGHDVPLSANGMREAEAAAAKILSDGEQVDGVLSSPLSRAAYGACRIAEAQGRVVGDLIPYLQP